MQDIEYVFFFQWCDIHASPKKLLFAAHLPILLCVRSSHLLTSRRQCHRLDLHPIILHWSMTHRDVDSNLLPCGTISHGNGTWACLCFRFLFCSMFTFDYQKVICWSIEGSSLIIFCCITHQIQMQALDANNLRKVRVRPRIRGARQIVSWFNALRTNPSIPIKLPYLFRVPSSFQAHLGAT